MSASDRLSTAVSESAGTVTDAAVDAYARGLLAASVADLNADVAEQNRQLDVANAAGERSGRAVLGLSFAPLAGVLVGLAAVLRAGPAGWITLMAAIAMTLLAGLAATTVVAG